MIIIIFTVVKSKTLLTDKKFLQKKTQTELTVCVFFCFFFNGASENNRLNRKGKNLIERIFISLTEFEYGRFRCGNFNFFLRFGVQTFSRRFFFNFESTESGNLDFFAIFKRFGDGYDNAVEYHSGVFQSDACVISDFSY